MNKSLEEQEIKELKEKIEELENFIDDIKQQLIDIKDYEASNDCSCVLRMIATNDFNLCTIYNCPDRENCDGECCDTD